MALLGSVTVYAVTSGKMNEIPFIKRLGLKFSDEYENYKDNDVFQEVKNAETSVDLISTVCDDGFTILEFDVKLSKDDKEELRLGESIITDEDLEDAKKLDEKYIGTINYSDKYNTLMRFKSVVNTIRLEFNKNIGELKRDYNIIIDNEKYYVKNQQKVLKVSDYEYIVYQMYFLTDEVLQNKNTFTLTLELNEIANRGDEENYKGSAKGVIVNTTHNKKSISIDGKFNVEVSKEKALENTKKIEELIRQREQNISLAGDLKDLIEVVEEKEKNWKEQVKNAEGSMPEDIIETLNIVGKCKDVESEEYKDAMKLLNARVNNLESNLHIEIDMERIEDRSKALSYIGIEVADALKSIPTPVEEVEQNIVEEVAVQEAETVQGQLAAQEQYMQETTFEAKPTLWQKIKNSKVGRAIRYITKIRLRLEVPAGLPEGSTQQNN